MTDYISTNEAGRILGITRQQVGRLIGNGRLEATLFNGHAWGVRIESVLEIKDECGTKNGSGVPPTGYAISAPVRW
jgi:hypothetical protein